MVIYGGKLGCKRLAWYKCKNEKDEKGENEETSEEEDAQAN
jgi:hypothetical protein